MNPPPYTPRPTNAERSFGRNGKFVHEGDQTNNKWPVAKWLFFLGFGQFFLKSLSETRILMASLSVPAALAIRILPPLQWSSQTQRTVSS
jgi:hypothetical protein